MNPLGGATSSSSSGIVKGSGVKRKGGRRGNQAVTTRWDPALIGPFCRWRSCLDDGSSSSSSSEMMVWFKHVCPVHAEIKAFLDRRSGSPGSGGGGGGKSSSGSCSEASRYLLRKALVPEMRKGRRVGILQADMTSLLHASSLLQVRYMVVVVVVVVVVEDDACIV